MNVFGMVVAYPALFMFCNILCCQIRKLSPDCFITTSMISKQCTRAKETAICGLMCKSLGLGLFSSLIHRVMLDIIIATACGEVLFVCGRNGWNCVRDVCLLYDM